jgi:antitoxin component of MazEF toxin-antitoxin module
MAIARVARVDGMFALLLPQSLVEEMGAEIGDEFDIALENQTLVVRPRGEAEQITEIDAILEDLMREREAVYRALAQGAE